MKKHAIFCLICLIFLCCQKDEDLFVPDDSIATYVQGSVGGLITDNYGSVVPNASVHLETRDQTIEIQTDENGVFYFRDVELNTERTYIYVESGTHFMGSRTFVPRHNSTAFIEISLMQRHQIALFDANTGGTFEVPGGSNIDIAAAALRDAAGNDYSSTVTVMAGLVTMNTPYAGLAIPGNLTAQNEMGETISLATYGMIVLEMYGSNGEKLQIKEGGEATIRFPVAEEQLSTAPSTIALWYFDLEQNIWKEDGQAQFTGSQYEANISSLQYWNKAVAYPSVEIEADIQIGDYGKPLANGFVKISVVGSGNCYYGYTNDQGRLEGTVPANQVLLFQIYGSCGEVIYESEIGPYSDNTPLGDVVVESSNGERVLLSGRLIDCDEEVVTNGYIKVFSGEGNNYYFTSSNGGFNTHFDACDQTQLSITGYDMISGQQSIPSLFQTTELINAGPISICDDVSEYFNVIVDGEQFSFPDATAHVEGDYCYLTAEGSEGFINMTVGGTTTGSYSLTGLEVEFGNSITASTQNNNSVTISFIRFGEPDNDIVGQLNGTFDDNSGNSRNITGSFKIIRTE